MMPHWRGPEDFMLGLIVGLGIGIVLVAAVTDMAAFR